MVNIEISGIENAVAQNNHPSFITMMELILEAIQNGEIVRIYRQVENGPDVTVIILRNEDDYAAWTGQFLFPENPEVV